MVLYLFLKPKIELLACFLPRFWIYFRVTLSCFGYKIWKIDAQILLVKARIGLIEKDC